MFGSSPSSPKKGEKDGQTGQNSTTASKDNGNEHGRSSEDSMSGEKRNSSGDSSPGRKATEDSSPSGDKKRRSLKASSLFASARNSLHLPGSSQSSSNPPSIESNEPPQNPIQQLGNQDPALAVPQGSQNNSAGESLPGAKSTFRVGVTEDKNKKCRRTMEDTHSYLYNFLRTPAPSLAPDTTSTDLKPSEEPSPKDPDRLDGPGSSAVETDNGYFAIFDGHAGTFAAEWCGKKLHGILEDAIRENPNTPIPELLDQTFTSVDQQLERLPVKNSGCTAVIAVLRWEDRVPNSRSATGSAAIAPAAAAAVKAVSDVGNSTSNDQTTGNASGVNSNSNSVQPPPIASVSSHSPSIRQKHSQLQNIASRQRVLYTANVGDARIVLCRNGKALRLSYDHKGSDENEGKRVANAGGLILNNRVNGVLAVTRALGDSYMKDLVTGHPYTTETVIQPDQDEFIILACDGLWDVCTDQEAVDLVRNIEDPQVASKLLVDHALAHFSTDNLSCMIVRFDGKALQNRVEQRTEPMGVEGDPAIKKGGSLSEADALVLEAKQRVRDGGGERDSVSLEKVAKESAGEPGPEMGS